MDAFPAYFPLAGRRVVIVGDGEPAEAKARLFEGSPAQVARLAGDVALGPDAYAGAALAFVAGGDEAFVTAAAAAARSAGVPVNVVDHPALCDFITPAVVDRGEVVAAVGTTGAAPMLAALLRNDLEATIPEGAGRVAALFRQLREEIRVALPDLAPRRAFMREALSSPAAQAAMDGDMASAERLLRLALQGGGARTGRISIIDGAGPADRLSLKASRALSLAEVLVADPGCAPGVLGLVRRDAQRLDHAATSDEALTQLAREGAQVVLLVTRSFDDVSVESEGIAVERLPSAPA
jgi:precorrin-2 dehydrogenase/sirohydrochlorin ferrochelatase